MFDRQKVSRYFSVESLPPVRPPLKRMTAPATPNSSSAILDGTERLRPGDHVADAIKEKTSGLRRGRYLLQDAVLVHKGPFCFSPPPLFFNSYFLIFSEAVFGRASTNSMYLGTLYFASFPSR